jgi:hypothetical protein
MGLRADSGEHSNLPAPQQLLAEAAERQRHVAIEPVVGQTMREQDVGRRQPRQLGNSCSRITRARWGPAPVHHSQGNGSGKNPSPDAAVPL